MDAGKMRETITIERPSETRGTLGQAVWEAFTTARAELKTEKGRELQGPQMSGSEVSFVFVTRYIVGVTAAMRVVMGPRTFRVTHVIVKDEGNARSLEMYCKEILTQG